MIVYMSTCASCATCMLHYAFFPLIVAPNVKFDGEKRVQVNGNLTITCIADSVPPPSSVELFDAQNGTVLASYPAMGTNTSTEVRLDYLFEPTELGQPMFTCNATNDIGTGTASVVITVQGRATCTYVYMYARMYM